MSNSTIDFLLQECESDEPDRQAQAVIQLKELRVFEAIPSLIKLLSSTHAQVRSNAAYALSFLGANQISVIAPMIMEKLIEQEELVRCDLIDTLAEFHYEPAIEIILLLLDSDPSYLVRASAAEALVDIAQVEDDKILRKLEKSLNDSYEEVRIYSAYAIGILGNSEYRTMIKYYIVKEESIKVKAELFAALYRLGEDGAINCLLDLLVGEDEEIIFFVINILKNLMEKSPPQSISSKASLIEKKMSLLQKQLPSISNEIRYITKLISESAL